jgi:hypothetical protein
MGTKLHGAALPSCRAAKVAVSAAAFGLAALALSFFASGETGAPVLGSDGIWRTSGDWTVSAGDDLEYANATIEVSGTLTLQQGAALRIDNATVAFTNATGQNASIKATNANLTFVNTSVISDADLAVSVANALFETFDSRFARPSGTPAALRISGEGIYNLEATSFGTLYTVGGPQVALRSIARIELANATGTPVQGRVNGSTGSDFFFEFTDAQGRIAPRRILWMLLSPAPAEQTREARVGGPLIVTGFAQGVGGNTSAIPIGAPYVNVTLRLDHPFDVGMAAPLVANHGPEGFLRRVYYVDPNETLQIVVRIRNAEGTASPALSLNVTWSKADPSSWAPLESQELAALEVPALAPGETHEASIYQVPGVWGTLLEHNGRCFESDEYHSVFTFRLPGGASGDFGPWNDTARLLLVAYRVTGDPTDNCTEGAGPGSVLIGASATGAFAGVVALTYYFSGERPARRAARRAEMEKQHPPK